MRRNHEKTVKFSQSLCYNKRCSLPVGETFLKNELEGYVSNLTKETSIDDIQFDEQVIEACIPIVFPNCSITLENYCKRSNFCTSSSSAFQEVSRPQIELLKSEVPEVHGLPLPSPFFSYGLVPSEVEGKAVLLPEPLKARTICTINHMEFYAGKPVQKILCSSMKRSKVLLFGRDASVSDIEALVSKSRKFFGDQEELYFVSGDYKNATGFISPWVSRRLDEMIMDKICNINIPVLDDYGPLLNITAKIWSFIPRDGFQKRHWVNLNVWLSLSLRSCDHISMTRVRKTLFINRRIYFPDGRSVIQTNEQLMGDIKSFPILCLLNYSLWFDSCGGSRRVEDVYDTILGRSFELYDMPPPCLINGDDFLAYAPLSVIKAWEKRVESYSFVLSVGKTYISKTFGCINSTMFSLRKNNSIQRVSVFRMNIPIKTEVRPFDQVSRELMLEGDEYYPRLLDLYIKWNRPTLDKFSLKGKINWFLTPQEGGLGLESKSTFRVTRLQSILRKFIKIRSTGTLLSWLPSFRIRLQSKNVVNHDAGSMNTWDMNLIKGMKDKRSFYTVPWKYFKQYRRLRREQLKDPEFDKFGFWSLFDTSSFRPFELRKRGFDVHKVFWQEGFLESLKPSYCSPVRDSGYFRPLESMTLVKSLLKERSHLSTHLKVRKPGFVIGNSKKNIKNEITKTKLCCKN